MPEYGGDLSNGISTSLPLDIQMKMLRSIKGLEDVEMMRQAIAIEYDFVDPTELRPSLETKKISGLFHADRSMGPRVTKRQPHRD